MKVFFLINFYYQGLIVVIHSSNFMQPVVNVLRCFVSEKVAPVHECETLWDLRLTTNKGLQLIHSPAIHHENDGLQLQVTALEK